MTNHVGKILHFLVFVQWMCKALSEIKTPNRYGAVYGYIIEKAVT